MLFFFVACGNVLFWQGKEETSMKKSILLMVALLAQMAAFFTVNSTCSLIIYEPEMPEKAKELIV